MQPGPPQGSAALRVIRYNKEWRSLFFARRCNPACNVWKLDLMWRVPGEETRETSCSRVVEAAAFGDDSLNETDGQDSDETTENDLTPADVRSPRIWSAPERKCLWFPCFYGFLFLELLSDIRQFSCHNSQLSPSNSIEWRSLGWCYWKERPLIFNVRETLSYPIERGRVVAGRSTSSPVFLYKKKIKVKKKM